MVEIEYDRVFKKHFRARISRHKNLKAKYEERLKLFLDNRENPILKDHKLIGKLREQRAFNITGNVRVIYKEVSKNYFVFLDIGTHPQIYGM